jgi:hypothetical protein
MFCSKSKSQCWLFYLELWQSIAKHSNSLSACLLNSPSHTFDVGLWDQRHTILDACCFGATQSQGVWVASVHLISAVTSNLDRYLVLMQRSALNPASHNMSCQGVPWVLIVRGRRLGIYSLWVRNQNVFSAAFGHMTARSAFRCHFQACQLSQNHTQMDFSPVRHCFLWIYRSGHSSAEC